MTGNEYKRLIGRYIAGAYGKRGLKVYDEVYLGTSIIGKQRRIDLFVVGPGERALCVECKYQDSSGTADEKIPYAINDMAAQRVPGVIVYAGIGFSAGVLHLLQGSEYGAFCLPDEVNPQPIPRVPGAMNTGTWQLDHVIAQTFCFWDIVLAGKQPLLPSTATPATATPTDRSTIQPAPIFAPKNVGPTPVPAPSNSDAAVTAGSEPLFLTEPLFHRAPPKPAPIPGKARSGKSRSAL
jgi:hypothetical protein